MSDVKRLADLLEAEWYNGNLRQESYDRLEPRAADYEAAVEALERLHTVVEMFFEGAAGDPAMQQAEEALRRLREGVPA